MFWCYFKKTLKLTLVPTTGRPRPKGAGISFVEVYEMVGESVISVCKNKAQ